VHLAFLLPAFITCLRTVMGTRQVHVAHAHWCVRHMFNILHEEPVSEKSLGLVEKPCVSLFVDGAAELRSIAHDPRPLKADSGHRTF